MQIGTPNPDRGALARFRRRRILPGVFKVFLVSGAVIVCWQVAAARLTGFDTTIFWAHIHGLSAPMIFLSVIATGISFAAISGYDLIAFRALGSHLPNGRILRTGAAATAAGQLIGFGLIIGAFVRWRLLRRAGIGQATAAGASVIVTTGFLFGLGCFAGAIALVAPDEIASMFRLEVHTVSGFGALSCTLFALVLLAGMRGITLPLFGRTLTLPRPRTLFAQVALAGVDVFFAGTALWLLMPAAAGIDYGTMLLAYVGVLAICLVANVPGGVGPLEAALLFAFPGTAVEPLIAGVVAFRLIYYVVPGALALLFVLDAETGGYFSRNLRRFMRRSPQHAPADSTQGSPFQQRILDRSHRAEDQLALLGDKSFLIAADQSALLMYRENGRAIIALGDPIGNPRKCADLCDRFLALAAAKNLTPVLYKTGPQMAYVARTQGLSVARVGMEAVIDLGTFTIADRARREIRRKVRKAAKAGVTILMHEPGQAPLSSYEQIATEWQNARRHAEAGFSMGRFEHKYLRHFPIYEAQVNGVPVAFISIWRSGNGQEWSVDVMRHGADAPAGTVHALIVAACDGARAAGAKQFNLCLAPFSGLTPPQNLFERFAHLVYKRGEAFHSLQGLYRFKSAFRPTWHPRYIARKPGLMGLYGLWAVRGLIMQRRARPALPLTAHAPPPKNTQSPFDDPVWAQTHLQSEQAFKPKPPSPVDNDVPIESIA
ncbi:MAG: bifunctional lysylphosphatidylglycerol flippase/synthetase MprF [Pikeienuella sp.]